MMKFSMLGSPFQKIWHVYEPMDEHWLVLTRSITYPLTAPDGNMFPTWFGQRHQIRNILHEDSTLKLEFRLAPYSGRFADAHFVLGLIRVDILAAKKDGLEEVDMVLQA